MSIRPRINGRPDAASSGKRSGPDRSHSGPITRPTRVPRQVSPRHAFRQQVLSVYLNSFLPNEILARGRSDATKNRHWLFYVPDMADLSPALETSVLAVCTARLGLSAGDPRLLHQSLIQYNNSLLPLQRDLCHPALRCHDQTLAACMALTMFEFSECRDGMVQGYLSHLAGALELLRFRGPELHRSGLAHGIFRTIRLHTVRFHGFCKAPSNSVPLSVLSESSRFSFRTVLG